jgi:predicted RNA-binding Zn-ribbon protein involved in translation (DUF1610 family)
MEEGFTDPCVRCTDCQRLIFRDEVQQFGCCPDCGNKRVRNVLTLKDDERQMLEQKGYNDFLKLFEGVPDA